MAGITREERARREAAKMAQERNESQGETQEQAQKIAFVKMIRNNEAYPAPHTANVHPDEVVNYQLGGWVVAPEGKE